MHGLQAPAGLQDLGQHPSSDVLQDLTQGLNEWRSIQEVVRLTFKSFHDVLRSQGEAIKALERSRDDLALSLRNELSAGLQRKAAASEVVARLTEFEAQISRKADVADMDRRALRSEVEASLRTQMSDVYTILNAKSESTEVKAWRDHSERQVQLLRADVTRLSQALEDAKIMMSTKAGAAEVAAALASKADLVDVEQKLKDKASRKTMAEALSAKADAARVDLAVAELRQMVTDAHMDLARKADSARVEEVYTRQERLRARVEADSDTASSALRTLGSALDSSLQAVDRKVEEVQAAANALQRHIIDVEGLMERLRGDLQDQIREQDARHSEASSRKADAAEVHALLDRKADVEVVRQALAGAATMVSVAQLQEQVSALSQLTPRLDAIQRDVANKMSADRAVYSALESKADIEDVNRALLEVCKELEGRAGMEQVEVLATQQQQLVASVRQHHTVGRWLWKSGRTQAGAVPWNVQALNTEPSVFLWEPDRAFVVCVAPGLYQLTLGLYSRKRPVAQVLVNGEPVLTVVSNSHTLHHTAASLGQGSISGGGSAGGARPSGTVAVAAALFGAYPGLSPGKAPSAAAAAATGSGGGALPHSAGNVAGLTCNEFLSLPANARVAIMFQGDDTRTEAFLMLKKL